MANLFDRTYNQLSPLQEAFKNKLDAGEFFSDFLEAFQKFLTKEFQQINWFLAPSIITGVTLTTDNNGDQISSVNHIISVEVYNFQPNHDFDLAHPEQKNNWVNYKFLKDDSHIMKSIKDILENRDKYAFNLINHVNHDFANIEIKINKITYKKEPAAYAYYNALQVIRVSKYFSELHCDIELTLTYKENGQTAHTKKLPSVDVDLAKFGDNSEQVALTVIAKKMKEDTQQEIADFSHYKIDDWTDEVKKYAKETLVDNKNAESIPAGYLERAAHELMWDKAGMQSSRALCLIKISSFEHITKEVFPPDFRCPDSDHHLKIFTQFPVFFVYTIESLLVGIVSILTVSHIPLKILLDNIEYVKVFLPESVAVDITNVLVKAIRTVNLDNLKKSLDSVDWTLSWDDTSGTTQLTTGTGFTDELEDIIVNQLTRVRKFTIEPTDI